MCDRLVFDEISLETVMEIWEQEKPLGVIVSMGGQTPNNLALKLSRLGVNILGTSAQSIDRAEDRKKFSALCDELGIDQPRWAEATAFSDVEKIVTSLGGFPVLVRPSYVLSGAAMRVAHTTSDLESYLKQATDISPDHPVVISKFEEQSREVEFDGVAERGEVVLWAISEHIEDAGVHSGDATLVLPPQGLYVKTIRQVRKVAGKLAKALNITGPFNIQLLSRYNYVKVIECNLRASRSFPFVSKVLGTNFIREATRLILGVPKTSTASFYPLELDYVAVKFPQFSFRRLGGADPILGVEMASTGEVACFGEDTYEALLKASLATGFRFPTKGVLVSIHRQDDKFRFFEEARLLVGLGLQIYATPETAKFLQADAIPCQVVDEEGSDTSHSKIVDLLKSRQIDLVISVPPTSQANGKRKGFQTRRLAIDLEIPLITDLWLARRTVWAMHHYGLEDLKVESWNRYITTATQNPTLRQRP